MLKNSIKTIGHRGVADLMFENTIRSVKRAIDLKVDYIEIDVWKTTDNEIIVFHDYYLDRLTNSSGLTYEKSYDDIKNVHLKNGDNIPLLDEIIPLISESKIPLIVEVKAENAFDETKKILSSKLPHSLFVIGSFFHNTIKTIKASNPLIQTAIMFECKPFNVKNYLKDVNADFAIISLESCDIELSDEITSQSRKLLFYTVNSKRELDYVSKFNPYGVITNNPLLLR